MRDALTQRTLELVNIPSPSRHEAMLLAHVAEAVSLPLTYATDEALLFATERTGREMDLRPGTISAALRVYPQNCVQLRHWASGCRAYAVTAPLLRRYGLRG